MALFEDVTTFSKDVLRAARKSNTAEADASQARDARQIIIPSARHLSPLHHQRNLSRVILFQPAQCEVPVAQVLHDLEVDPPKVLADLVVRPTDPPAPRL